MRRAVCIVLGVLFGAVSGARGQSAAPAEYFSRLGDGPLGRKFGIKN